MNRSFLMVILSLVVIPLLIDEFREWCPKLARALVRWAARRLGDPAATERYEEEWLADLYRVPGSLGKLTIALSFVLRFPRMRWVLRTPHRNRLWAHLARDVSGAIAVQPGPSVMTGWFVFAWIGTALLVLLTAWMLAWSRIDLPAKRPPALLFGWGIVQGAIRFKGHASFILLTATALLSSSLVLALRTGGFRRTSVWCKVAYAVVSLAGVIGASVVLTPIVVLIANILVWALIIALAILLVRVSIAIGAEQSHPATRREWSDFSPLATRGLPMRDRLEALAERHEYRIEQSEQGRSGLEERGGLGSEDRQM